MMNLCKNLSIKRKLIGAFGTVGLVLVCMGWISFVSMNQVTGSAEFIYKTNLLPVTILSEMRAAMLQRTNFVIWHILATDTITMGEREKRILELDKKIEELAEQYAPAIVTASEKKLFEQFKGGIAEYKEVRKKVLELSKAMRKDAAVDVQKTELVPKLGVLYDSLDGLFSENKEQAAESYASSHTLSTRVNWIMIALNVGAMCLGLFLTWFVSKLIVNNLTNVLNAARDLQGGHLTARATVESGDEIGQLATAFNQMADELQSAVGKQELALQGQAAELNGVTAAIGKSQAAIEFNLDGTILTANDNFLRVLGYTLGEIKGQHHRMFCEPAYTSTGEYTTFWAKLNRGEYDAGVYRRVGKGGKAMWIQASYNPILDANGKVYKVVKFASDITAEKQAQAALEACMTEAQQSLGALAQGDLTHAMQGTYTGDLEKIKISLNAALATLSHTISTVRDAVESVTSGSEQITKGSEDLSQRTSEQASSLEETSASMEEMTSTVKQNADNAKQANQLAIAARETANKGGVVTKRAVDAMGEINKSSKKIADIITVIDEIAFQTNLLALNAAVEAARAGEHGRGFAVVASEVRSLAQRSAMAAKEIKGLINESIQRVLDGSELVNQSGKTLEDIVESVKRVTDITAEISAASQEQASGIDQVNKAILSMDEVTQQNAALVEETTSAAQSMKDQAKELMRQVEVFLISETTTSHAVASADRHDLPRLVTKPGAHVGEARPATKRSALVSKSFKAKEPVGLTVGNGKDRRQKDSEFEEF